MEKLLVATHNQGKVVELAELLADLNLDLLSLDEAGVSREVAETGNTFRDNAILKVQAYARETGLLTLADDSGLEVDALEGRPGVHTARFGGEGLNHEERYQLLLEKLKDVRWEQRTARFRCVVALATPERLIATTEGTMEGHIAFEPAGNGGFGYDPVFFVDDQGKTTAQLPAAVKNRLSHRGRAVLKMKPILQELLEQGE